MTSSKNQNVEQLESSATILYYLNKLNLNNYDENNLINILSYLKPHIDKQIIENVYVRIAKLVFSIATPQIMKSKLIRQSF